MHIFVSIWELSSSLWSCASSRCALTAIKHLNALWLSIGWGSFLCLLIIKLHLVLIEIWDSWPTCQRLCKFSWISSALNLSQCTIIHFVSLLHHLDNIILSLHYILLRSRWKSCATRGWCSTLGQILIANIEIRHFAAWLGIVLSSLWASCWIAIWGTLIQPVAWRFLCPFAWSGGGCHLIEICLSISLALSTLNCWILLAWKTIRLLLSYLWLETNWSSWCSIKNFFIHWITVSVGSIYRIHWIKRILNLFVLLSAHILRLIWHSCVVAWTTWCKFQIEIDSRSKLINIYCILRWLINIGCGSHKSIIAWAQTHCWPHCRAELSKLSIAKLLHVLIIWTMLIWMLSIVKGAWSDCPSVMVVHREITLDSIIKFGAARTNNCCSLRLRISLWLWSSLKLFDIDCICLLLPLASCCWCSLLDLVLLVSFAHELLLTTLRCSIRCLIIPILIWIRLIH